MIRVIRLLSPLAVATLAFAAPSATAEEKGGQPSDYRPGVTVEYLYRQQIDAVYFTTWYGRLEKADGGWRDVYFETSEKFVNKGLVSFNCTTAKADIGLILYSTGKYGEEADRRVVRVRFADRKIWASGRFEPLYGETPPYEFYLAARKRFCR